MTRSVGYGKEAWLEGKDVDGRRCLWKREATRPTKVSVAGTFFLDLSNTFIRGLETIDVTLDLFPFFFYGFRLSSLFASTGYSPPLR